MNIKDLSGLLQQAKDMHRNMARLQAEAANVMVEGESGGGLVRVTATGAMEVRRVDIDPSLLTSGDKEMLEDLVAAAFNAAVRKAEEVSSEKMSKLMPAGMPGMPAGMKFPF